MQEFASLSAETPVMLTELLNAKAADGWSLVSIHTHGGSLVAFLGRSNSSAAAPAATEPVAVVEAAPAAAVNEPAGWASAPTATAAPAAAPVAAPATQATPKGAPIPANWYPDPSGRFDLRYWDGSQWTEHVSRAGQQFVDPPVA